MSRAPSPSPLVLVGAVLLSLPTVLLIAGCFLVLYEMAGNPRAASSFSGPAWMGVVMFPVPAALLVMTEYRAIYRRDARAAAWVAGVCLWFPVCGSIGWVEGLLNLTGVLPRNVHRWSWAEFAIFSAMLAYMAFVGLVHLSWWRVLRASKEVQAVDLDA